VPNKNFIRADVEVITDAEAPNLELSLYPKKEILCCRNGRD
jgi:hypothetical protein